jgi:hypothetical protein
MFPLQQPLESGRADYEANKPQSVIFERWDRIVGDPELMGRVKWAKVKSEKRVVEKVYRCYAGDVSRLFDCCRSKWDLGIKSRRITSLYRHILVYLPPATPRRRRVGHRGMLVIQSQRCMLVK